MKRIVALWIVMWMALPIVGMAGPKIVCKVARHDFGRVEVGTNVTHKFLIENHGDAPLKITEVRDCCGSTSSLGSRVIPAGSNTVMQIDLLLKKHGSKRKKNIYVRCNDPKRPFFMIQLLAVTVPKGALGKTNSVATVAAKPVSKPVMPVAVKNPVNKQVVVDYFYEPDCEECKLIKNRVLPILHARFGGQYVMNMWDVNEMSNIVRLAEFEKALGVGQSHPPAMVFDSKYMLPNFKAIKKQLRQTMQRCVAERKAEGSR